MLQVIISPAKQMRVCRDAFAPRRIPPFPRKTEQLYQALCALEQDSGPEGLKALWRVNDKLLAENRERLHAFVPLADDAALNDPACARSASAAIFSYVGIQYQSLAAAVLDEDALAWLDRHLWIISGFYGCVRPFDAVEPYRLEMGAKLAVAGARDLYAFWGEKIAQAVCAGDDACGVVNLASVEYAKAVLPHLPAGATVTTCLFGEELRAGKPVQRATASKIARGSMVRWMAEHGTEDPADLVRFDIGYRFAPELSGPTRPAAPGVTTQTLVFMRSA